jgi:hypothetical protein
MKIRAALWVKSENQKHPDMQQDPLRNPGVFALTDLSTFITSFFYNM